MHVRPQLRRGARPAIAVPNGIPLIGANRVPTPMNGPMAHPVQITDPRVAQLLNNLQMEIQAHKQEVANLQVKLKHFMGALIVMLQDPEKYPDHVARIKLKDLESIPLDTAIDTDEIVGEYVCIRLSTQSAYMMKIQGLSEVHQVVKVPKRSPYRVQVEVPKGGEFKGVVSACYSGGKHDGQPLVHAEQKAKKVREFNCDKDGWFLFTVDSSGFDVAITYVVKKPVEPETEADITPLDCDDDFHKNSDAPGVRCMKCGDSRKVEGLVTA